MKLFLVGACAVLVTGCEAMGEKIDASRQDRCARADWAQVGERDGVEGANMMAERYQHICGDMYDDAAYKAGFSKGFARRPKPVGG